MEGGSYSRWLTGCELNEVLEKPRPLLLVSIHNLHYLCDVLVCFANPAHHNADWVSQHIPAEPLHFLPKSGTEQQSCRWGLSEDQSRLSCTPLTLAVRPDVVSNGPDLGLWGGEVEGM